MAKGKKTGGKKKGHPSSEKQEMVANYKRQIITLQEQGTIDKARLDELNAALNALEKAIWLDPTKQCNDDEITNLPSLIDTTDDPSLKKNIQLLASHVGAFNTAAERYRVAAAATASFTKDTLPKDVAKESTNARAGANRNKTNTMSVVVDCLDHFIQQATKGSTSKVAKKIRAESAKENATMKSKTNATMNKARIERSRNEASKTAASVSSFKPDSNKTEAENEFALNQLKDVAAIAKSKTKSSQDHRYAENRKRKAADAELAVSSFKPDSNKTEAENEFALNQLKDVAAIAKSKTKSSQDHRYAENRKRKAADAELAVSSFKPNSNKTEAENESELNQLKDDAAIAKSNTRRAYDHARYQEQTKIYGETREELCIDAVKVFKTLSIAPLLEKQSADSQECFRQC